MAHTHGNHPHQHGAGCGHTRITHDGHADYLHDGHLHHQAADGSVEEHTLPVGGANPAGCTPSHACAGHACPVGGRWRRQSEAKDYGQPTASTTRWRVSVLPSEPLPVAGVGRARWLAELMRVKAGECCEFELGAPDAAGRMCILPLSADGKDQAAWSRRRAG